MNLIFDTSVLIEIERANKSLINKLKEYVARYPAPAKITFINYFEYYHGIRDKNIKNKEKAKEFIGKFEILKLNKKTAEILSDLKKQHDYEGNSLPLADLMIASQVIENNCILITMDKDFKRIKALNKIIL